MLMLLLLLAILTLLFSDPSVWARCATWANQYSPDVAQPVMDEKEQRTQLAAHLACRRQAVKAIKQTWHRMMGLQLSLRPDETFLVLE